MSNPNTEDELVAIRVFSTEAEAMLARCALEAFGIECMVSSDDCGGQRPHWTMVNGIRLMVKARDVALARDVLREGAALESEV